MRWKTHRMRANKPIATRSKCGFPFCFFPPPSERYISALSTQRLLQAMQVGTEQCSERRGEWSAFCTLHLCSRTAACKPPSQHWRWPTLPLCPPFSAFSFHLFTSLKTRHHFIYFIFTYKSERATFVFSFSWKMPMKHWYSGLNKFSFQRCCFIAL